MSESGGTERDVLLWRDGAPLWRGDFLRDAARIAAQIPPATHLLNLCEQRETFPVRGTLSDGTPFNVTGVRNQAKNAGDDVPLKPNAKTIVIDHGDMTPEQSARYEQAQRQPVFPNYETSGLDGANCVAAHLELTRQVFGHDPGPLHPHATPQEAARAVETLKTQ